MKARTVQILIAVSAVLIVASVAHAVSVFVACGSAQCPDGSDARVVRGWVGPECFCVVEAR